MNEISKLPFIKWTGSKRKQAPYIVSKFPKEIDTYYECFVGGASVLHELLNEIYLGNIKCNKIICSDLNRDLINIWNIFIDKTKRQKLFDYYCNLHNELKYRANYVEGTEVTKEDIKKCQTLYYEMRNKYNSFIEKNIYNDERAMIFYWITRTSFNGLIRYNPKNGKFNSPFHVGGRFGIIPNELQRVFDSWGLVIDSFIDNGGKLEFICDDYINIIKNANNNDIVYMDPPYANTGGMYFMKVFDYEKMYDIIEEISNNGAKVLLSFDGKSGKDDRTENNMRHWYKTHEYVDSGHSSFKKLKSASRGKENKDIVYDSLYMNY